MLTYLELKGLDNIAAEITQTTKNQIQQYLMKSVEEGLTMQDAPAQCRRLPPLLLIPHDARASAVRPAYPDAAVNLKRDAMLGPCPVHPPLAGRMEPVLRYGYRETLGLAEGVKANWHMHTRYAGTNGVTSSRLPISRHRKNANPWLDYSRTSHGNGKPITEWK